MGSCLLIARGCLSFGGGLVPKEKWKPGDVHGKKGRWGAAPAIPHGSPGDGLVVLDVRLEVLQPGVQVTVAGSGPHMPGSGLFPVTVDESIKLNPV